MTLGDQRFGKVILAVAAIGYLLALCVTLIWWHLSPWLVLALTIGGIGLVTIALRPYLGLHAVLMILFFENAVATKEGVTGMKIVGAMVLAGWLCSLAMRGLAAIRVDRFLIGLLLFLAWGGVTVTYALDSELALVRVLTYALLAMAALMFGSVVDSPARLRGIYGVIVFWTTISTIVALVQYYLGMEKAAVGFVRNRNLLALYINFATVCAFLLYQTTTRRLLRIALVSALPILFVGLCLTLSRTGLLVQFLGLVLVWYRAIREKRFFVLAVSAVVLGIITLMLPENFWTRAWSILPAIERQEETFGIRVRLWKAGLRMIEDRPITGVGPGNFEIAIPRYTRGAMVTLKHSAHNTYVSVAAEMGSIGLILFLGLFGIALREAQMAVRAARLAGLTDLRLCAVITEVNLILLMATGLTMTVEGLKYTWVLFGIALGIGRMRRAIGAETPRASEVTERALSAEREGGWGLAPIETR